jgi:outer membrane protein
MKFAISVLVASLSLPFGPLARASEAPATVATKIALVDMQKALQSVEAGKKAKAQLEKEFNAKKKDLQSEEASIKKMGEEFRKQSMVLSDEARAKKQSEIQEKIMKFQEATQKAQMEIQQKEQDLTQPILGKIRTLISELAKKKGFNLILEKSENTVLFSEEKDDLTEEVISTFNKSNSKG